MEPSLELAELLRFCPQQSTEIEIKRHSLARRTLPRHNFHTCVVSVEFAFALYYPTFVDSLPDNSRIELVNLFEITLFCQLTQGCCMFATLELRL